MKRAILATMLLMVGLLGARGAISKATAPEQTPQPEMIGEGVISTPNDEFSGSISPDGREIYFDVTVPPHYLYTMCVSRLIHGAWSKPEVLPFSGQYRDSDPVLSPDGKTLLFASDRPLAGSRGKSFYIWAAQKTVTGWNQPTPLEGAVNSEGSQVFASVSNNGDLYFTSDRKGQFDIYRSRLVNGKYPGAEDLGPKINAPTISSLEAFVAPDGSYLLIGSFGRQPGYGSSDLFISYNEGGSWSEPKNLGPAINTLAREYSPRVTADGKWLIFTSERGMQTEKREKPLAYQEFIRKSRSIFDGLGNIYRIPMDYVLRSTQP
jgi:Tol biopolymer transport system component